MIYSRAKKFLVPGVGPTIIILMSQFKDFIEYSRCLATAPLSKWNKSELVSVGCISLHTLPTSTMPMSRSVQWECPPQWFLGWCLISVSINLGAPTTNGTTSVLTEALSFSPYLPEEFWARVHVKPDAHMVVTLKFFAHLALVDKLVEQWWSFPEVVGSIPTQLREFSPSLGERSSWSCWPAKVLNPSHLQWC